MKSVRRRHADCDGAAGGWRGARPGFCTDWGPGFEYQKQFFTGHSLPMHHADRAEIPATSLSATASAHAVPDSSAAAARSPETEGASVPSGMDSGMTGEGMPHDATAIAAEEVQNVVRTMQHAADAPGVSSLVRYDIEISGFPSSHCGHLVLLRLQNGQYPGTKIIDDWPSWNIPILRWARRRVRSLDMHIPRMDWWLTAPSCPII